MKRLLLLAIVVSAIGIPPVFAESTVNSVVFEFDLDQYIPDSTDTEEILQEKAIQFTHLYNLRVINSPVWSPDGSSIAFISGLAIWSVSPDGSNPKVIDSELVTKYHYNWIEFLDGMRPASYSPFIDYKKTGKFNIAFTPDGSAITYSTEILDASRGSSTEVNRPIKQKIFFEIESVDAKTGEISLLLENGTDPVWSPDGRYLAYIKFDPRIYEDTPAGEHNGALALLDTETGEERYLVDSTSQLMCDASGPLQPSFSPDGSEIVFRYKSQICKISVDGGEIEQLTDITSVDNTLTFNNPSFSPDGRWILFDFYRNDSRGLLLYDTSDGKIHRLINGEIVGELEDFKGSDQKFNGSWSPDGTKICSLGIIKKARPEINGIVVVDDLWNLNIIDFDPDLYLSMKPTSVEDAEPAGFAIKGNYPNPFNPSTTIEFSIAESRRVSLEIYNSAGQKIRELVNKEFPAGAHAAVWDGLDESGIKVSSGTYFARLKAGDLTTARQMMLMK